MSVMVSSMSAHNDGMPPTSPLTSVSSVEQLAASITASINIGVLVPGVQLSEVALAQQYGVSRNTLREAFRLLARDGLVEHVPHRGVFVRTMTAHDLKDIYAYRRFVELGAITYAYSDATFNCTAMSRRIETTIANAKAAPSLPVNTAVCVRNPGPMALVAMRKMAPRRAVRVDALAAACPSVGPCCDVCSGKAHAPIL